MCALYSNQNNAVWDGGCSVSYRWMGWMDGQVIKVMSHFPHCSSGLIVIWNASTSQWKVVGSRSNKGFLCFLCLPLSLELSLSKAKTLCKVTIQSNGWANPFWQPESEKWTTAQVSLQDVWLWTVHFDKILNTPDWVFQSHWKISNLLQPKSTCGS